MAGGLSSRSVPPSAAKRFRPQSVAEGRNPLYPTAFRRLRDGRVQYASSAPETQHAAALVAAHLDAGCGCGRRAGGWHRLKADEGLPGGRLRTGFVLTDSRIGSDDLVAVVYWPGVGTAIVEPSELEELLAG